MDFQALLSWISPFLLWLMIALVVLWIVAAVALRQYRRAYNLSQAEVAGSASTPDFLKVDHARRQAEMQPSRPDLAPPPAPPKSTLGAVCVVARAGALITAILSLLALLSQAIGTARQVEAAVGTWSSLQAIRQIVVDHPIGVLVAVVVILVRLPGSPLKRLGA